MSLLLGLESLGVASVRKEVMFPYHRRVSQITAADHARRACRTVDHFASRTVPGLDLLLLRVSKLGRVGQPRVGRAERCWWCGLFGLGFRFPCVCRSPSVSYLSCCLIYK